jgi:FkbM family methyltransferase
MGYLINVGGHTFDPALLTKDGCIIDVGCRAFEFGDYFRGKDKKIWCIDPDPDVFVGFEGLGYEFLNVAISDKSGESFFYENGEATVLKELDTDVNHPFKPCKTITLDELYEITGTNIDVLKLDCEGAEYLILNENFKPIPKQISIEFHHHTIPEIHKQRYTQIVDMLSKDYTMLNDVWEQRHGCGFNYWDTLFIKKDLK